MHLYYYRLSVNCDTSHISYMFIATCKERRAISSSLVHLRVIDQVAHAIQSLTMQAKHHYHQFRDFILMLGLHISESQLSKED